MSKGTNRRQFISTAFAFGVTSTSAYSGDNGPIRLRGVDSGNRRNDFKRLSEELYSDEYIRDTFARDVMPDGGYPADQAIEDNEYYDPALLPPPESAVDFAIEPVDPGIILPEFRVQSVQFTGSEEPGTLVVVPQDHFLYHVTGYRRATRYGVGVGRAGFTWSGQAVIQLKRRWPRWVPPRGMVDRDPKARKWVNGQPGGPDNPLGARALYLYQNNRDTLYRIHGTNEPKSIGKSVSSGCIRMLNQHIAALYEQVKIGTKVVVRSSQVNNSLVETES